MKVVEHLERAGSPPISFEIIPPKRGGSAEKILALVEQLAAHEPPFIDITSHAAVQTTVQTPDGPRSVTSRKRPGTVGLCALVQRKYQIDAVPHVLCNGFTREETEDLLIELNYLGIDNVLAIRGDGPAKELTPADPRAVNHTAADLIDQVQRMNRGEFLGGEPATATNFCVGCSGYPEKHFAAASMEDDLDEVVKKVRSGAEYVVTQMFFNNERYFNFVRALRERDVHVPIIPGLKVLTRKKQLEVIPRVFHCEIPSALAEEVRAHSHDDVTDIGVEWAVQQMGELLAGDAPSVHFYVMLNAEPVMRVLRTAAPRD